MRSRVVQHVIYRPAVIEALIRGARRWPFAAVAAMALADVINEHLPLAHIARRALMPDARDRARADQLVANGCVLREGSLTAT